MRLLPLLLALGFPAWGTILIALQFPDRVVLGADSKITFKVRGNETGRMGRTCKIVAANDVVVGIARVRTGYGFDAARVVADAIKQPGSFTQVEQSLIMAMTKAARRLAQDVRKADPESFATEIGTHPFVELFLVGTERGVVQVRQIKFRAAMQGEEISIYSESDICLEQTCAYTTADDAAAIKTLGDLRVENPGISPDAMALAAMEAQGKASEKYISGPYSVVTLGKDGRVTWNQMGACEAKKH